jgi:Domain of unknown function (DUF1924)
MKHKFATALLALTLPLALPLSLPAFADAARDKIIADLLLQAKAADAGFSAFSADDGKAFWQGTHAGGKPDTPSCTTCHTKDPKSAGQTRVGKAIEPMAVSANPKRFTDAETVAKWFLRNCNSVLGRECTAAEKGNVISYLASQ